MLNLLEDIIDAPPDPLWVICDEQFRLRAVEWDQHSDRMEQLPNIRYRAEGYQRITANNPGGSSDKLSEYFAGNLSIIDLLETAIAGTPFQREIWRALHTIPCGQVMYYDQLAEQLGRLGVTRAIGIANSSDPVSIVVPCHCAIERNDTMTGYAGGVQRKKWLLHREGYLLLQIPGS